MGVREIPSPAPNGSFSPRVTSQRDGGVTLSWLEPQGGTTAELRFSVWRTGTWSGPIHFLCDSPISVTLPVLQNDFLHPCPQFQFVFRPHLGVISSIETSATNTCQPNHPLDTQATLHEHHATDLV